MPSPRQIIVPERLPKAVRAKVILRARTFDIYKPADMEDLLDLPEVRTAFADDDYMPYWADIWPASRMMARAILEAATLPADRAVELGCGLGLSGLAALSRGVHVTFSDYDVTAVTFAERNAQINGFTDFAGKPIDWRNPPTDLKSRWILGADILYEDRNHDPIVNTLSTMLEPNGEAWLTDADRPVISLFLDRLRDAGYTWTETPMRAGSPGQRRVKGTLYKVRRADGSLPN